MRSENKSEMSNTTATRLTWVEGALLTWHCAQLIFIPFIMAVGITGNLLVLYIYHFRLPDSKVAHFKKMLAILDLTSLTLACPTMIYLIICAHTDSFTTICIIGTYISLSTANASACFLVVIAVDRYRKLCLLLNTGVDPLLSRKLLAVSVILGCAINIPTVWTFGKVSVYFGSYTVYIDECYVVNEGRSFVFLLHAAMMVALFLIVSVTLSVLYYSIVTNLVRLTAKHEELQNKPYTLPTEPSAARSVRGEVMKNSAIVFIAVTAVFFASYAPYFVVLALTMTGLLVERDMTPGMKSIYDVAKLSPLLNHMANPFIYSFIHKPFMHEVKKTLSFSEGMFRGRRQSIQDTVDSLL